MGRTMHFFRSTFSFATGSFRRLRRTGTGLSSGLKIRFWGWRCGGRTGLSGFGSGFGVRCRRMSSFSWFCLPGASLTGL